MLVDEVGAIRGTRYDQRNFIEHKPQLQLQILIKPTGVSSFKLF